MRLRALTVFGTGLMLACASGAQAQTDELSAQDPPAVQLESALLDQYVGTYRVGADIVYTISRQGDHLTGAVNGGSPVVLAAELRDVLFTPGHPRIRKIFQRDESGRVTGYVSRREGRDVMFTKSS